MKLATILLTLATALAFCVEPAFASTDSLAFARFRADSTLAAGFMREARSLDSSANEQRTKARDRTVQAQTIYQLAVQHLQQDTARKVR